MSVHWDRVASQQAMHDRPQRVREAMYDAMQDGVNVAAHKASLHPPGSSKRTKKTKQKAA